MCNLCSLFQMFLSSSIFMRKKNFSTIAPKCWLWFLANLPWLSHYFLAVKNWQQCRTIEKNDTEKSHNFYKKGCRWNHFTYTKQNFYYDLLKSFQKQRWAQYLIVLKDFWRVKIERTTTNPFNGLVVYYNEYYLEVIR